MNSIELKGIVFEDFVNYKVPSMFLITNKCDWKCCTEAGKPITLCQNSEIAQLKSKHYLNCVICDAYARNDISQAIVIGGLEPMLQFEEVYNLIKDLRQITNDDIVIYTGYDKQEIEDKVEMFKEFKNIIIKFGRFIPNQEPHFDAVLGVNLASDNQYGEKIS